MLKRIGMIFLRDLKVNTREFLSAYILIFPILIGIAINLLAPSINDTTVNLAFLNDQEALIEYSEQFAKVEVFDSREAIEDRINERDNIVGLVEEDGALVVLAQGNEPESVTDFARLVLTFDELDVKIEDSTASIYDFGKTKPPFKAMFVNLALLMTSVLGGMIIAVNIIEEKGDNTIAAMNLTPTSRPTFIMGKSVIGLFLSVYGAVVILLLTGYGSVNVGQAILTILSCSLISILVGFIEGIKNDDVMNAAAGVKMLFLPLAGAVAAVELLSDQWQMLFYWVPFYWTYRSNAAILDGVATWPQIILYTGIVIGLSAVVIAIFAPQVRKGLE